MSSDEDRPARTIDGIIERSAAREIELFANIAFDPPGREHAHGAIIVVDDLLVIEQRLVGRAARHRFAEHLAKIVAGHRARDKTGRGEYKAGPLLIGLLERAEHTPAALVTRGNRIWIDK